MSSERNKMLINNELMTIVRKVFYYGCYSAKDFEQTEKIKSTPYSRYKNFLLDTLGNYIEEITLPDSKASVLHFKTDEFEIPFNILLDLYTMKKISEQDFLFFLETMLFFTIEKKKKEFQFWELSGKICIPSKKDNEENISDSTFQRYLKELSDYGYLERSGKKVFRYAKPEDLLSSLDEESLYRLTAFIDLCRNFCHPAVCGHYLLDTIDLVNRQKNISYEEMFRCKHLHMGQVLDDEKLWTLLTAIHDRKIIRFRNKKGEMRFHQPYKIIINEADGRRYLFCIPLEDTENKRFLYRLDKIFDIQEESKKANPYTPLPEEEAQVLYSEILSRSFTGTTAFQGELQTATLIYQNDFYLEIRRHFPDAVPEETDTMHHQITIEVNSLRELKPWLRRHLNKVRMINSSDDTADELEQELKEWRAKYGIT